jgi:protein ImuB
MEARSEPDGRLTKQRAVSSKLPSSSSDLPIASILAILHKWGIHTLGQLAALDKEELRVRLGNEAVTLWLRANGTATRLLKFVQPPEAFEESFEFDHEIETAEPLLFMLRRFLEQLALRLSSIYLVAKELTLRISFSNQQSYERVFKIPQPTNDVDLLFRMLQTHLENPAAARSEYPIVAVALTAQPIRPASQQFGLFETALRNPQQLYETLARLSALLGSDRVGTPALEETHRPDAFRMEPFAWRQNDEIRMSNDERNSRTVRAGLAVQRPALRRFRPPANTSVFVSAARYLESDKIRGQIVDQTGPFLLSGNWWDEKSWARAEWDMQLENGDLIRAHESPPSPGYGVAGSAAGAARTWKIDGIYD